MSDSKKKDGKSTKGSKATGTARTKSSGSTGDSKNQRKGFKEKTSADSGSGYDNSGGKTPAGHGTEFHGSTSNTVNAVGDSGNQNRLAQQQRDAASGSASRNPGSVKDAIITESSVAYQNSDKENKDKK